MGRSTTFSRRARAALALAATAAVLGVSACGGSTTSEDAPAETAASSESSAASDGGAGSGPASDGASAAPGSDGGNGDESAQKGSEGEGASDEGSEGEGTAGAPAAAGRTPIVLAHAIPDSAITKGNGEDRSIGEEALDEQLGSRLDAEVSCTGDLPVSIGSHQSCSVSGGEGMPDTWYAYPVQVSSPGGYEEGTRDAVLFVGGGKLLGSARKIVESDHVMTGLGMGSMFGSEPIAKDELGERTLQVLRSENAYAPLKEYTGDGWKGVTCDSGLEFEKMQAVHCVATTDVGSRWEVQVLPGAFADNDGGLLVGLGSPHDV